MASEDAFLAACKLDDDYTFIFIGFIFIICSRKNKRNIFMTPYCLAITYFVCLDNEDIDNLFIEIE